MYGIRTCVAAVLLTLTLATVNTTRAESLGFKVGLGYEFLSQEYFFEADTALIVDTLEANLALKTNYLDNIKGQVAITYDPWDNRQVVLRSVYEQTDEDIRLHLYADIDRKIGSVRFQMRNELDWRHSTEDSAAAGDSYVYGLTQGKLTIPVSQSVSLWGQLKADFVRFDSVSSYNVGNYRVGGKFGVNKTFADFSILGANVFVLSRRVPDSLALNYLDMGAEGSYFGFYDRGEIDVYARFEHKDYEGPGSTSDYSRFDLDGRHKVTFGRQLMSRQELEIEMAVFPSDDLLNYDYVRTRLTILGGLESGSFTAAAGPMVEKMAEETVDNTEGQDYLAVGLEVNLDYLNPARVFVSIESTIGYRNLSSENDLQSDFTFERLSMIADWQIIDHLSWNVLFSAEWEWHDNSIENNQIYLLSSGLSYTF